MRGKLFKGGLRARAKDKLGTRAVRKGALSMGMIALVIAIVVVVNLIAAQLPENIQSIDLTDNRLYEISDTSRKILKDLDQNIEMKVLAVEDSTDDRIKTFLSKYTALSDKIDVEWIDPIEHPSALEEYDTQGNAIVVSCPDSGKSRTVDFGDILVVDEMSYYTTGNAEPVSFDAEGQLTSAIHYVTSDDNKKIYLTTGHGEGTLGKTVTDMFSKNSLETEDWNLLMKNEIPDDCDLLLMYAPTSDLTEDEAKLLTDYLSDGGKVCMILGAAEDHLPNLEGVMKTYGLEMADGYIADPDRCYQGNYYYIFPVISAVGELAEGLSTEMVLLVNARGMTQTDPARDTITVTPFMKSSDTAHAVTEDGDEEGTYVLGAVATEKIEKDDKDAADAEDKAEETADADTAENESGAEDTAGESGDAEDAPEARLTVLTSPAMIDEQIVSTFTTLENTTLFVNAVSANFDDIEKVAIEPKSLETTYNTMKHGGLISLALIIGLPAIILIGGFAVWWRRRKA